MKNKDTLSTLSQPEVIEEIDFEAILNRRLEVFAREAEKFGIDVAPITRLRTDPVRIALEEACYAEMSIRVRQNHMYRAKLLYFAHGTDLDHVAEEYGVTRLENEPDEDLRIRVRIHNRGSSAAGPDDWWRFHAMKADERVEDVAVTRVPVGPDNEQRGLVRLSILAQTSDGIPSEQMLERVRLHVASPSVRPVGSSVEVVAATSRRVDVHARIWLLPDALPHVFEALTPKFISTFAKARALGWDVTPSWIIAQLQKDGVQRVELLSPSKPVIVAPSEAPVLGTVNIENAGINS